MGISQFQLDEMQRRLASNRKRIHISPDAPLDTAAERLNQVERERDLHEQIIKYCNSQWPRWKYIHSRMDRKSTVAVGSHDFTIFTPNGRTVCVECKKRGEKLDGDQRDWKREMEMIGHTVHTCWSMDDFLKEIQ